MNSYLKQIICVLLTCLNLSFVSFKIWYQNSKKFNFKNWIHLWDLRVSIPKWISLTDDACVVHKLMRRFKVYKAANVFNNNNFEVSYIYMLERLDKLLKKKIIPNKHITRPLVEPNLKFSEALHCWFHEDWSSLMLCYRAFCFFF